MSEKKKTALFWTNIAFIVCFIFWAGYAKSAQDTSMTEIEKQRLQLQGLEYKYYESQIEFHEYMTGLSKEMITKTDISAMKKDIMLHIDNKVNYIDGKVEWEHELKKTNDSR